MTLREKLPYILLRYAEEEGVLHHSKSMSIEAANQKIEELLYSYCANSKELAHNWSFLFEWGDATPVAFSVIKIDSICYCIYRGIQKAVYGDELYTYVENEFGLELGIIESTLEKCIRKKHHLTIPLVL
jgi:hypothetical protein